MYGFAYQIDLLKSISMRNTFTKLVLACFLVGVLIQSSGCKKAEELWDAYWEGVFDMSEGWQIELSRDEAIFITAGNSKPGISTGSKIGIGLKREDGDSWRGSIRNNKGFGSMVPGAVDIIGNVIVFNTDAGETYGGTKGTRGVSIGGGSGSGGSTGGGSGSGGSTGGGSGGGTTGPVTQFLINQKVEGNRGDKKIFRFTVPSGTKTLEVKISELPNVYYYNTADMGVRYGSDPTVTLSPQYRWVADCAPVKSNREEEVCFFNNPRTGQYSVMLFGYNTHFTSHLTVKITK